MSLNIKNPEAHALATRLAKKTGETLTDAVTTALRERLERLERTRRFDEQRYQTLKAIADGLPQPLEESLLSIDHGDLLYDERGLPK